MENEFRFLFSPLQIGSVTVPNRIFFPAHATMFAENNLPSERLANYYEERAKGGVGLIITEIISVHPTSFAFKDVIMGFDRRAVEGFKRIADGVHRHGTKIFCQLYHSGADTVTTIFSDLPVWAPSSVPGPASRETPHEMESEEIDEVIEGFVQSARNAKEAGFDGIELHGGHGYLINQFLSPHSNRRNDDYGGSIENRLRFLLRIIEGVRNVCGPQMTLGVRISGDELSTGGLTLDDMKEVATRLERTKKINYLSVSVGNHSASYAIMIGDMNIPLGAAVYLAAGIKGVVNLPVFTALRIKDALQAEKILTDGQADMIGMCRALITDPELPRKAKEGRLDNIRNCIACNQECLRRIYRGGRLSCIQNPAVGHEKELGIGTINISKSRKEIMIIGGGPGGMEAARVAALRGHKVSLYEKKGELGGQIALATQVPNRRELGDIQRYLVKQLEKLNISVVLGTEVTPALVKSISPDIVIVATGSEPIKPSTIGITNERGIKILTLWEALDENAKIGEKVVILDAGEGSWQCYSVAEYLAERAREIEILSKFLFVGIELNPSSIIGLYQRLLTKGVIFTPVSSVKEIRGGAVISYNLFSGKEKKIEGVDTLIVSLGNRAQNGLYRELKGKVAKLFAIGDCVAPRKITDAIREGNLIARQL